MIDYKERGSERARRDDNEKKKVLLDATMEEAWKQCTCLFIS